MNYSKQASPIISVVLPAYNAEKFIAEAMNSILNQTFVDLELIVINDGSTDATLEILQNYQAMDARIRLFSHENRGLVTTLNEGIDLATGVWLARMDADDIAMPQRFERQLQCLTQTGADICGSWVKLFGTKDNRILKYPQTDLAIKMALLFGTAFAHPTVIMKTDLAKQLYYVGAWENAEDYDLWERAARAGYLMANVPEVLLWYRQHPSQMSSKLAAQQQVNTQKIRRRYWEFLADSMEIEPKWIDEVMKIREPLTPKPNMDYVDFAFTRLLQPLHGEARTIVFDQVTRLYFRVAANCPDVVTRWGQLNKNFGCDFAFGIKLKLWLLSVLHINSDSSLFNHLKNFYFYYVAYSDKD